MVGNKVKLFILKTFFKDKYGDVSLRGLEAPELKFDFRDIKAKGIYNSRQKAREIFNNRQKAREIYNSCQEAKLINNVCQESKKIDNSYQEAKVVNNTF